MALPVPGNLSFSPSANHGPTSVTVPLHTGSDGFNVVFNTAPLAGNGSIVPMLAIAGAGVVALWLVGRK